MAFIYSILVDVIFSTKFVACNEGNNIEIPVHVTQEKNHEKNAQKPFFRISSIKKKIISSVWIHFAYDPWKSREGANQIGNWLGVMHNFSRSHTSKWFSSFFLFPLLKFKGNIVVFHRIGFLSVEIHTDVTLHWQNYNVACGVRGMKKCIRFWVEKSKIVFMRSS